MLEGSVSNRNVETENDTKEILVDKFGMPSCSSQEEAHNGPLTRSVRE